MATVLYRLGRVSFRRRKLVVVLWLVLLTALGGAALAFKGSSSSDFTMPGTESQQAIDALQQEFPEASGATGTIVVAAAEGRTLLDPQLTAAVKDLAKEASAVPGVVAAIDPITARALTEDGRYGLIQVQFAARADEITDAQRTAYEKTGAAAERAGLRVEHGGEVLNAPPEVGGTESIGVAIALMVLLVTFGSLVAAGMTMLNALIGVGAGMAGLFALSSVVSLTSTAPVLALMLGLAVGIDYSLFITSRHRQHLAEGFEPQEAAARAVGTAGSAVVFAGLTVVIALAGLSVVNIPFLTVMGFAAAATVAVAVLVAITLLPALLGFAGARILPRKLRNGNAVRSAGQGGLRLHLGADRHAAARTRDPGRHPRPGRAGAAGGRHAPRAARRGFGRRGYACPRGRRPDQRGLRPRFQRPPRPGGLRRVARADRDRRSAGQPGPAGHTRPPRRHRAEPEP